MNFLVRTYRRGKKLKRWTQLLVLISFVLTLSLTRITTHLQRAGYLPNQTHGVHIHHLVPGIWILIITGYIGIGYWHNHKLREWMAIFYGIGAALTIDEFALWLFLHDVYWEQQGRDSTDAIIITVGLMLIVLVLSEIHDVRKGRAKTLMTEKTKEE